MDKIQAWKNASKEEISELASTLQNLKGIESSCVDEVANKSTQKAYNDIDCLSCANCCKSAPTTVKNSEIKRIAKFLNISKKSFESTYLIEDFDGDLVMNKIPCPFLNIDNTCQIYEVRPETCRSYPHTDKKVFMRLQKYHIENLSFCPITFDVVKEMKNKFESQHRKHDL